MLAFPSFGEEGPGARLLATVCHLRAEDVVVEGSRAPDPGATSASLTVIPLGPEAAPARDLAAVLDTASGTTVRRLGGLGDFATLSLRGSTAKQVEIFLDGVPLNPDGAAVVNLAELPVSGFERVEIYRGNAPARFGAAAMGGVVNLVTPSERQLPAAIGGAGGSFGTAQAWALAGPRIGELSTFIAMDQFHTEGDWEYFDDQGTEYNLFDDRTPVRQNNAIDRSAWVARVSAGPLMVVDSFAGSGQELPGSISEVVTRARLDTERNLLVVAGEARPTDRLRLQPRAWWLWRQEILEDPEGEIGLGAQRTHDVYHTLGVQGDLTLLAAPWCVGALTLRARRESYASTDLLAGTPRQERLRLAGEVAASADARFLGDRLTLTPVVQGDFLDSRYATNAASQAQFLPRLGVLARPWPWLALKANGGRYARSPDLTELFGDHGTLVGNDALVPETGWAFDVGARLEPRLAPWIAGSLDLAYARNYAEDLIVWVQNAQDTARAENVGAAYVRTTEASLAVTLFDLVDSQTNYTGTLSRNLESTAVYSNNALPGLPETEFSQSTGLRWAERVAVSHTWSYTSGTFTDAANYGRTAPRDLHSVAIALTPLAGLPTVRAEVLNLLDTRGMAIDRDPLNDDDDALIVKPLADFSGYPLPGRTVMVSVSWAESPRR